MPKDVHFSDKGDRTRDFDRNGWSCSHNDSSKSGHCSNNRDVRSFDYSCSSSGCKISTSNVGNTNQAASSGGSYSSGRDHGGSYSGAPTSVGFSCGSRYSPQEQHIINVGQAVGFSVLGGAYGDNRKSRATFEDNVNYQVKGIDDHLNYYGFQNPKGIVLYDCDLIDMDIGVLVQTLKPYPFNLTIIIWVISLLKISFTQWVPIRHHRNMFRESICQTTK